MTELSGSLAGVGLPSIVRFLTGLKKTGCLRLEQDDWHGEIFFEAGLVYGATFGPRRGLSALDALAQGLPGGSFGFESDIRGPDDARIGLSSAALLAHLDDIVARAASGTPGLPSLESVPRLVVQDDSGEGEELPLDRGTLQTMLAVDGRRSVREIVTQRGTFDAWWQMASLNELGLIELDAQTQARAATAPVEPQATQARTVTQPHEEWTEAQLAQARIDAQPASVEPRPARAEPRPPIALDATAFDAEAHCPKLGFEDDPVNSFARPTRLHRCFAASNPLPLSLDQQRELCLSDQFATCPRLIPANPPQPAREARPTPPAPVRAARIEAEPDPDDPRIVRLPFAARAASVERGAVADRHAVGGSTEPTRFRSPGTSARDAAASPVPPPRDSTGAPAREGSPPRTTPMRARIERPTAAPSAAARPAPRPAPAPAASRPAIDRPLTKAQASREAQFLVEPPQRGLPRRLMIIAGGALAVVLLICALAFLFAPQLGRLFADESIDPSVSPNAAAVARGTPVAQVVPPRATAVAAGPTTVPTADASTAPARPAAPAPNEPAAQQPTAATQLASTKILDERFANNSRNWPDDPQGPAQLVNGSYHLAPLQAGQFVAVGAPIVNPLQNVTITASFHKVSGPSGGGYGIIVRDQAPTPQNGTSQNGRYYVLEVGDKGDVGIWRRDDDHWADLLPWQHADAVKPGTAINEVTVRASGTRLSLSVNGTEVASRTDATYTSGSVGIFVGGDGNVVAVDRFTIQTP